MRQLGSLCANATFGAILLSACSSNDNSHTTATTIVTPPPRQVLTVVPPQKTPAASAEKGAQVRWTTKNGSRVDPSKPLLILMSPGDNQVFRPGEVVVLEFSILNAKLKSDGGEYSIRYFVDDDDARWIDDPRPFGLTGWLPGKHTIRLELIGPDGWPYRNGDQNIIRREITISAP